MAPLSRFTRLSRKLVACTVRTCVPAAEPRTRGQTGSDSSARVDRSTGFAPLSVRGSATQTFVQDRERNANEPAMRYR